MPRYFFRDGTPFDTEFALPVNAKGWCRVSRGIVYTEVRLRSLEDSAFIRAAHRHDKAETALHRAKHEFGDFMLNNQRLIEDLEKWAFANELLDGYLQVINNRLALTDFEIANARVILKKVTK